MTKVPKKRTPEEKMKIVIEALSGEKTIVQLAADYKTHPRQITRWREKFLEEAQTIFIHRSTQKAADPDKEKLLHIIDELTLELEFLKKKLRRHD
jgi:putative transposase